jgi:hypothetical protein
LKIFSISIIKLLKKKDKKMESTLNDYYNLKKLQEVYENLVCKFNEEEIYIEKVFEGHNNNIIVKLYDKDMNQKNLPLSTLAPYIKPYTKEDVENEVYADFISKIADNFSDIILTIYADFYGENENEKNK